MNRKKMIKTTLIIGLFFLGLGGWLLHLRLHPPTKDYVLLIPFISGSMSIFCIPILFWFRKTFVLAYIFNGFTAIIGTITMTHFSIAHFQGPFTAQAIILNTTLADISILWGKFALGKALFGLEHLRGETDLAPQGHFFRYPNMGWWWVHLIASTTVYTLGNITWK